MSGFSWERFHDVPIVGILRRLPLSAIEALTAAGLAAGLTTIEVTADTPGLPEALARMRETTHGAMHIGVGTVCTRADLDRALVAGAMFVVTPVLAPEVIAACREAGVPVFAGAYTPSEIYQAWSAGADMVKVFPADQLGPEYIRTVRAPLPQVPLLPTGGVTLENLAAFMQAGAAGCGIGSPLFPKELVAAEDWPGISTHIRRFVEACRNVTPYV
jgi:2-dehydro-3-deoxyphosphogluconate aldolase/(4S)-4-hydroxy-2-oxoglutarate aldolase